MTKQKNKGGRPTKLKNFLEAFKKVMTNDEFDIVILTDDELREECNSLLSKKDKICVTTFENWKAGKISENPIYQEFLVVYKKALANQKRELFKKLKGDPTWQRYAWIIERKFDQWNLKKIVDSSVKVKDYTFTSNLEND